MEFDEKKEIKEEEIINKRTQKIKDKFPWLKDPYNLAFVILLVLFFIIRIYYFSMTYNQPLWWDEADYMDMARTWLGKVPWDYSPVRPILFPSLISLFMLIGLGEFSIKFFILLSSIVSILLLYKLGDLFFNKRVAIISASILAFFWSFNFYSYRVLVDVPIAMLWLATIYFFFDAYFNNRNWKQFAIAGIFLGLAFLLKYSSFTLVVMLGFYLITTEKFRVLTNKKIITFFLVSLITILPLFIFQYVVFGHPLQFLATVQETGSQLRSTFQSLIDQSKFMFELIFPALFAFFIFGLITTLFYIFLSWDITLKKKTLTNNYYFILIWLLFSIGFFAKINYGAYMDERYYFVFYPAIFLICGVGFDKAYLVIKKYNKILAIIIISVVLLFAFYQHSIQANNTIKLKKDSFLQLKLAGEYIKENTKPGEKVFVLEEQAEIVYYSERPYIHIGHSDGEAIMKLIKEHNPPYVVMSLYYSLGQNQTPVSYILSNQDIFQPVQAYGPYIDEKQTLPIATIFRVNSSYY
ncbi:MAG: glycosyltransferase family 39 protein [archaeon]